MGTTYRYKSDTATREAVMGFFGFGLAASTMTAITASVIVIAMHRVSNCDYMGFQAAVLAIPATFVLTWVAVSGFMCLAYSRLTRDDPPPPPKETAKKQHITRSIKGRKGGKGGKFTWDEPSS